MLCEHWLADNLNWSNFWFNHSLTTTVNIFFLFATWKLRNQPHYSNSNRTALDSFVTLRESSAKRQEKVLSLFIFADIFWWNAPGMASRAKSSGYFSIYLPYNLLNWSNAFSNQCSNKWLFLVTVLVRWTVRYTVFGLQRNTSDREHWLASMDEWSGRDERNHMNKLYP